MSAIIKLTTPANKKQYTSLRGKMAILSRSRVRVYSFSTHNQYGSWERGFKFSDSEYGYLTRVSDLAVSIDHGVSWHPDLETAKRATRKGRIKLSAEKSTELAFEGIQRINRAWDGPGYKWRA